MSKDNIDWDNFSCVEMMRSIRNNIDAKLAIMTKEETLTYFNNINQKFDRNAKTFATQ